MLFRPVSSEFWCIEAEEDDGDSTLPVSAPFLALIVLIGEETILVAVSLNKVDGLLSTTSPTPDMNNVSVGLYLVTESIS